PRAVRSGGSESGYRSYPKEWQSENAANRRRRAHRQRRIRETSERSAYLHHCELHEKRPGQDRERPARQATAHVRFRQVEPRGTRSEKGRHRIWPSKSESMADPEAEAAARRQLTGGRTDP